MTRIAGVVIMIVVASIGLGSTHAAELEQHVDLHSGHCDGPEHWNIPVLTNPYPGPIHIVSTRIVLAGAGYKWAFLTIRGRWLAWAHDEGPHYSFYKDTPAATVTLNPGETVYLHHHCLPPNTYGIYSIIDYTVP